MGITQHLAIHIQQHLRQFCIQLNRRERHIDTRLITACREEHIPNHSRTLKCIQITEVGRRLSIYARLERSEEHTSELQSRENLVCRLLLEKKKHNKK